MKNTYSQGLKKIYGFLLACFFLAGMQSAQAQFIPCPGVPTDTFDFVNNPGQTFLSDPLTRSGLCCSASGSDRCLVFVLRLDSNTVGVNFNIVSGAVPPGALFYQIDCGPQQQVGNIICINNPTNSVITRYLTFCKPGNNTNTYAVTSVARPSFFNDTVPLGCRDTMRVFGLKDAGATWTSISPGVQGQYNNLLSCTTCARPVFTPTSLNPSVIQYRVCGNASASACLDSNIVYCDTVSVSILSAFNTTSDQTVCQPTTTTNLGAAPVGSSWNFVSGPAVATIGASTGAVSGMTANGTYNFLLRTSNGLCRDTVSVVRGAKPNAGNDQFICAPFTTASLGNPPGGSWSFITGPAVAAVDPATGAVTGLTVNGFYQFQLGSGSCSDTVIVERRAQPASPTAGNNGPLCVGQTLNLTASTVPSATYSWVGPAGFASPTQNPSIPNVSLTNAGIYKVVSIVSGCSSDSASTTVVINAIPSAPSVSSNSPVCEGDTIRLFATGAVGASYSWSGPLGYTSPDQNPIRINATLAMAGNYSATQTVLGCISPASSATTVVVNPKPVVTSTAINNPTTCGGSNGSIVFNGLVAGQNYSVTYFRNLIGQGPVVIQANGGGQVIVTGLTAGSYTNFVLTLGTCSSNAVAGPLVLSDPSTPAAPGASSNSPVCEGETLNLFATGPGSAFSWTGPSAYTNGTQNPTRTPVTLAMAGTYCVNQTVSGCTSFDSCITVVVNAKPVIVSAVGSNPTTCLGINGSITLSGLSATQTYSVTYSRNSSPQGPFNILSNGGGQVVITGLNAATYTNFVVTLNTTGCVSTTFPGPVTLTDPVTPPAPVSSSNSPECEGDTLRLFAVGAGTSFSWIGPVGYTSSQQNPVRPNATLDMSGSYCVTQTIDNCVSSQSCTNIVISPRPVIGGTSSLNPSTCGGSNGCVYLNGLSPDSSYSVNYDRNGLPQGPVIIVANGSGRIDICGQAAGLYNNFSVTLRGCVSPAFGGSVTLTDPATPAAPSVSSNSPVCEGDTIRLFATGPGTSFSWTGPNLYTSGTQNPIRTNATLAMGGSYCATQTVSGCTSFQACTDVVVNARPVVTSATGTNPATCGGSSGSITLSGLLNTTNYVVTYLRNAVPQGPLNIVSNGSGQVVIPNLTIGNYTNIVVSVNGCLSTSAGPVVLVNPTGPNAPTATTNAPICAGSTLTLGVNATPGASYQWSGPLSYSSGVQNPTVSTNATTGMSGVYKVVVTLNGCQDSSTVSVTVNANPAANAGNGGSFCAGGLGFVALGGAPTASGGAGGYSYLWSPAGGLSSTTNSNPNASPLSTTVYTVTVTDANTCTATSSATVTVNPAPIADAGANDTICNGASVIIGGSPTASGGLAGYLYSWSGGAAAVANPTVAPTFTTTYTVTVTDSRTCSATSSTTVVVNANPVVNAGADQNLVACDTTGVVIGGTPTATGSSPFTFLWSPSAGLSDSSLSNPLVKGIGSTTNYTVVVTDVHGCVGSDNMTVNVTGTALGVVIVPNTSLTWCSETSGTVTFTGIPTGGTAPFSYVWTGANLSGNTGANTTANPSIPATYIYSVVITDATGCQAGDTISVTVFPTPLANAGLSDTICNGETVVLGGSPTGNGGTPPFTYAWNGGASSVANPSVSPGATFTYIVTVTDSLGCSATSSAVITVNSVPTADAGSDLVLPSCSPTGITIGGSPAAFGGSPGYTYNWSPASGLTSTISPNPTVVGILADATYTLVVTDTNGCTASDQVIVDVVSNTPSASISASGSTNWCENDGSSVNLTANVAGGTGPFTYSWTGSNISPTNAQVATVNPSSVGTYNYNVTVTDNFNCTSAAVRTVNVNQNPTASAGAPSYTICAGSNVVIGGVATGGTGPYSYAWSGGLAAVASPTASPASTTAYFVTVTDFTGCTSTATTTVNVNPNPVANAGNDATLPSCSPSGIVIGGSPSASGGTPGYTYNWSPATGLSSSSVANPTLSGILANANYTLVVTDTNGCTATDQIFITVANNSPLVSISASGSTSWCANSGGSVNLTANVSGGVPTYTYSWTGSNIAPTNAQVATVNPQAVGTYNYNVTVTDNANCTAAASIAVTVTSNPSANAGGNQSICSGESVQLGASPTAAGGTPGYTYSWSGGAAPVANPTVSPLSTTAYTLTVTDTAGCSATSTATITVRPNPVANAGSDVVIPSCSSSGIQIGGSPTASGGGGAPYSYLWSPNSGLSNDTIANPAVSGILADETYTVVVTDASGCSASDQVLVQVVSNSPLVNITSSGANTWCAGSGTSVNLTANVTGGTGPFGFAWSGSVSPTNTQVVVTGPAAAGTYNYAVTVTDNFGCTALANYSITVAPNPTANAGLADTICVGETVIIGGSPTASGGTPGYTYSWSGGLSPIANPSATPAFTTTYVVVVTDTNGCTATSAVTIRVNPSPIANAGVDQTLISCNADSVILGGSPSASGGSGSYSYSWSPATALNSITVANPVVKGLLATTTYCLTITDVSSGCTATDCATVTVVPATLQAQAAADVSYCEGAIISVNLGGGPTALGGTPPYTYSWSPNTAISSTTVTNPTANPTSTTTYCVTVTDANGCTSTDCITITVNPNPTANAGTSTSICSGSCVTIGGAPAGSGGTGILTYTWTPGTGLNSSNTANPLACPSVTSAYGLTVTDSRGCSATDNVTIIVNPSVVANAGNDWIYVPCTNSTLTLGSSPTAKFGTPTYSYTWYPSTALNDTTLSNPTLTGLQANTTYTVVVTDAAGCIDSDQVSVFVEFSTLQAEAGSGGTICFGSNDSVRLGATPTAVGGYSPYTYNWSPLPLNLSDPANPYAKPTSTTLYYVTVTDQLGCTATDSTTVSVSPQVFASAGTDKSVCLGDTVRIGGEPTASGGIAGYTYSWSGGPLNLSNSANPLATTNTTTTYILTVTDSRGCSATDQVLVTVRPNPVADAGPDKNITNCSNDTITIGGSPAASGGTPNYSYAWSPAGGLSCTNCANPSVSGIVQNTTYQLIVTDNTGCTSIDFVAVFVTPTTLQANAGNGGVVCSANGTPVQLGGQPTATGGNSPYTYLWSNGATISNPVVTVNGTTTFYVTVTDAVGCQAFDSVTVTQNQSPVGNAGTDTVICEGFCVVIGDTATGGTGPYQYLWSPVTIGLNANNVANPLACPQTTTTYSVIVTDANGCSATGAVTVFVNAKPVAHAGLDKTITTCPADSVQIGDSPSATGGEPPYTYAWSPVLGLSCDTCSNPWVSNIQNTQLYSLTVTDFNGCTGSDVVQVTVVPNNLSADAGPDRAICAGSFGAVTLGGIPTASGGVATYTYVWSHGSTVPNPVVSPLITTTYTVTVTDARGCTAVDAVTVTISPVPVVNAGNDTAICAGNSVVIGGSPTASGSTTPYTYSWQPGIGLSGVSSPNPTAAPTVTSTYSVTVTDGNGCTASDAVTVTVRLNPVANAGSDKTLVACSSDSVQIGGTPSGSGGSGTLTCLWTPPAGLSDTTNCNPWVRGIGSTVVYTLRVTDEFGCFSTDQVQVNVTNPTLVADAGSNISFCSGSPVSVTLGGPVVASGGTPTYTYLWSPGGFTVARPVVSPTQTTTYTLQVTDAAGCIAVDTVTITINPRPTADAGPDQTVCEATCISLGGTPTASGGTGSTYTYSWNPGPYYSSPTDTSNPTVCPLASVSYSVTVTDSLGCFASDNITINVNRNPRADAGPDQNVFPCINSCVTLGGTPTATDGNPTYFYAWSPNTGMNNTGLSNPTVCNLSTSTLYTVTVSDINRCTGTDQVLVTVIPSSLQAEAGPNRSICAGQTLTCLTIGGIPTATGGTGPLTYEWSPLSGICNSNSIPNPDVNPADTTTYVVLVRDIYGCEAVDSMTIFANPAVTASVGADTAICLGGCAQLGGNPTGSGGTPTLTYSWSPGVGLSNITGANPVACPTTTTTYCVTVTDQVGCSTFACQTVTVTPQVRAEAGNPLTVTACPGAFAQLGSNPTASNGSGNYSYQWSPPGNLNGTTIPNPIATALTVTTTFIVTVTDNVTGCFDIDSVTITVVPSTLTANAGVDRVYCANSSSCTQIGGVPGITPTASGGTQPYSYQWAPGNLPNSPNPCVAPLTTTTYYLTVTDALGCFTVDSMQVYVSPLIVANAGLDSAICRGSNITLGGNPTAVGGTGPLNYSWSPTTYLAPPVNVANPLAQSVLTNITYVVTVTDSLGCSTTDAVSITTRNLPTANAGAPFTLAACEADSGVLGGTPTASGTQGPYTYQWSPQLMEQPFTSNPIVGNLGAGTNFCVTVTDVFGCTNSNCVFIPVIPDILDVEAGTVPPLCANDLRCVLLGGNPLGSDVVNAGYPPYTYQWFGGATPPLARNPQACPTTTTTYTLVVIDAHNCRASDTVTVVVNQPPVASISGLNSSYCISSAPVTLTGSPSPGTFSSNGPGLSGNTFSPAVAGIGTWTITYRHTDPVTGCSDTVSQIVIVDSLPVVTISGQNAAYCVYEDADTLVGLPSGGVWSGSTGIGANGVFTPSLANPGNNTVTYTYTDPSSAACTNSASVTIVVNPRPVFSATASSDTVCTGQSVTVTPTYGNNVTNITWTVLGQTIPFASGLSPITFVPVSPDYCVVGKAIANNTNCEAYDTVCINVRPLPTPTITGLSPTYCIDAAPVNLVQFGNPQPGTFSGPGVSSNIFTPSAAGAGSHTLTYSYTDPNGCTGTTTTTVTVRPLPILSVSGFNPSYCPYDPAVTVIGAPNGGTFSGTGISSTGVFDPAQATVGNNQLTYTYTDSFGCTNTLPFVITVRPQPQISITASRDTVCVGQTVVISPTYSLDVSNILWSPIGISSLNPVTVLPTGVDYCINVTAVSNNGCLNWDTLCIHVNQRPVANDDNAAICEEDTLVIDVSANDIDPEGDASNVTVISSPNGTSTVSGGTITYIPNQDYNGNSTLTYVICNTQCPNECDTANVFISICPINDPPIAKDTTYTTCRDSSITFCVPVSDVDGDSLSINSFVCGNMSGTLTALGNGCFSYTPVIGFVGTETFCISACDTALCDSSTITIEVLPCNHPPVAVDDEIAELCDYTTLNIAVLNNDTDPDAGDVLSVTQVLPLPAELGSATVVNNSIVTYTPGTTFGQVIIQYVVCDNGQPVLCDTGNIIINVVDCQEATITDVFDTACIDQTITVCVSDYVTSTAPWVITSLCQPVSGAVALSNDLLCFNYTPSTGFFGNDTFCITVCDTAGNCDTSTVVITTIDCLIQAVDDPCDISETPMNTAITIDVLDNDIVPQTGDITVTVVTDVNNGTAIVNGDNTITITPDYTYQGEINFSYVVCATSGSFIFCDTADVCVSVIDTNCYIPNAFSPNGDGVNDVYVVPCNEKYPDATLRIFNRWGVEVWYSNGPYQNNFNGENMQGVTLPDGTYFLIYEYNDANGNKEAKFVVIHR